jgi:cytoskeletal protein RodZ/predicted Ser/Thr protein kinase
MAALTKAGRYQIVSELGRGSMGIVYRGFDPIINRTVAIKTMLTEGLTPQEFQEYKARFQREAQAAGTLAHPNIITIYDFGEDEGILYLAMEFLEGKSLEKLVQEQNVIPIESMLPIFDQVCSALDHAHHHKIVHRDIKPANVMILHSGTVKVTDFGIAKMMSMGMTQAGQILGTPNYMSPEQVKGKPVDGRSDIFALGVILYELITGEKPFFGQNITTVIYKIVNENPIPPRELDSTIHPGLSYVISKALAKSPDERYQTCRELAEDLKNFKNLGEMSAPSATVILKAPPIVDFEATSRLQVQEPVKPPVQQPAAPPPVREEAAAPAAKGQGALGPVEEVPLAAPVKEKVAATPTEEQAPTSPTKEQAPPPAAKEREAAAPVAEAPLKPPAKEKVAATPTEEQAPPPVKEQPPAAPPPVKEHAAPAARPPAPAEAEKRVAKPVPPKMIPPAVPAQRRAISPGIWALLILVALGALGAGGYFYFMRSNHQGQIAQNPPAAEAQEPPAEAPAVPTPPPSGEAASESIPANETTPPPPQAQKAAPPEEVKPKPSKKHEAAAAAAKTPTTPQLGVAAPEAKGGQLTVSSNVTGAKITIDGKTEAAWVTPYTIPNLPAGSHTVVVSKDGYDNYLRTVTVEGGQTSSLNASLTAPGGEVDIITVPAGLEILIDGKSYGPSPVKASVPVGDHTYTVRQNGKQIYNGKFEMKGGAIITKKVEVGG